MKIFVWPKFIRQYRKLPKEVKDACKNREGIFRENPFDPRLGTHKLKGKQRAYWAFSLNYRYRIIFRFLDDGNIRFCEIGDHDIYD